MKRIFTLTLVVLLLTGTLFPFMKAEAATADSKAGIVSTASAPLNVRSGASSASMVVATLKKGSYVTLLSKTGSWWKVEYAAGKYGYCYADYITVTTGKAVTVNTRSGSLNVRSGPGTGYAKVTTLPKGRRVLSLSASGGWSRILYNGTKTGYVSSQYLGTSISGSNALSLAVPSYKQTDSRWAHVQLGSSGKTIAKVGCATTAIAMMESYRTGTTIYPDAMSRQLRYTASGNVYWPSHYSVVTGSDYLNTIYTLLKAGKPVLFGAKNSAGGQHWVVVTGFSGGAITASNFTVNDPGSQSRTTLQQLLNTHPNFYKYFHY